MANNEHKKSSLPLLLGIFLVALIAGGGWYVYTNFFQKAETNEDIFATEEAISEFPLKKIDWNKAIFTSPSFRSLTKDYSREILLAPAEVGNDSPFLTERQ